MTPALAAATFAIATSTNGAFKMAEKKRVTADPLAGYKTTLLDDGGVGLVLEIAVVQNGKDTGARRVLQVAMKPYQADALAKSLAKSAKFQSPQGSA